MHRHGRRAVLKKVVLQERYFSKRGERSWSLRLFFNCALDEYHWNGLRRAQGQIRHQRFRRLTVRHGLGDGKIKGRGDAFRVIYATREFSYQPRCRCRIIIEARLRKSAVGCCVVESEWEATQGLRKRFCARGIVACRELLKQNYGFLQRQSVERDRLRPAPPFGKARRDQHTRTSGCQKVSYGIWRGDTVIDEEPCCALFCQLAQRSLRRFLNISFVCRCCTQGDSKVRKSTQEPRARFGRTPTNARIQTSKAVRILNGK